MTVGIESFDPRDVRAAQALISGQYTNFALVPVTYEDEDQTLAMIVAVSSADEEEIEATYYAPVAVLVTEELATKFKLHGVDVTIADEGATEAERLANIESHAGFVPPAAFALVPPLVFYDGDDDADDADGYGDDGYDDDDVDAVADLIVETTGGLTIQAVDGGFSIFTGAADQPGCFEVSITRALVHVMEHHMPDPGDALLAEDDPRFNSPLN